MNVAQSIWNDERGQDLIEYALLAGFLTLAVGTVAPGIASSMAGIYQKVSERLALFAS